ncbi:MAG: hypothetical protein FJ100_00245 [Deltaproteobacteria bacterium]|nr:hypothetical protein [Deltaproteobacteria bacterium]
MTPAAWLAWSGVALVAAPMVAYWAMTLGGRRSLWRLVGLRHSMIAVGCSVVAVGSLVAGSPAPAFLAVLSVAYQGRRQWLFPIGPIPLAADTRPVPDDAWLAVFEDGRAAALEELRRCRLARTGRGELLACCGLARSLIAVRVPDVAAVQLHLPLPVGFAFRVGAEVFDGTTGILLDGDRRLTPVALALASGAAWRRRFPDGVLLTAGLPLAPLRWPRAPGRTGSKLPIVSGSLERGLWTPLPDHAKDLPELPPAGVPWPERRFCPRPAEVGQVSSTVSSI